MNPPTPDASGFNRRDFLKGGSFATLMAMMGGVQLLAPVDEARAEESKEPKFKLKFGVIGLGAWGREMLDQLGRTPEAQIVAVCDHYPASLKRGGSKAPDAAQIADYKELLANKDVQAVIVATPTHLHKDIVLAALAAGKHVYCEMPLAHTIEDAKAIAMAAKNSVGQFFQSGLQMRCDPQRQWLSPHIRTGVLGKPVMARSQWHKKQSWRVPSPNPTREIELNWRLDPKLSLGLAGEVSLHLLDQAGWFFLNKLPVAVTGHGAIAHWKDGREVADTAQVQLEYPGGVQLSHDVTLACSFDAEHEIYFGNETTVMMRDGNAWMFKEVDAPLLGWEVYARRDEFYKATGIALVAGGSKQTSLTGGSSSAFPFPPLYYALDAFLKNCAELNASVEDFNTNFPGGDKQALKEYLASAARPTGQEVSPTATAAENVIRFAPRQDVGFAATVLAIKANEAVVKGRRIELPKEIFELA